MKRELLEIFIHGINRYFAEINQENLLTMENPIILLTSGHKSIYI